MFSDEAEQAVERCAAELAAFEAEALAAELPVDAEPAAPPRLRSVKSD